MVKRNIFIQIIVLGIMILNSPAQIKHKMLLADEGAEQILLMDENDANVFWKTTTPGGNRDIQLIGSNKILVSKSSGGYWEMDLTNGAITKDATINIGTTYAARRQSDGTTILAGDNLDGESGITIVELDLNDVISKKVALAGTSTLRVLRQTANGTFLVGTASEILEANWSGEIIWRHTLVISTGYGPYMSLRFRNGNTIVATGYESSLQEISLTKQLLRTVGGTTQSNSAAINPNFYGGFQVLTNGNIVVTNWQGHGTGHGDEGIQLLEYDSTGTVVWSWNDPINPTRFSSLHGVIILDGLDPQKLHNDMYGVLAPVAGCTDSLATNYSPYAVENDNSCLSGVNQKSPGIMGIQIKQLGEQLEIINQKNLSIKYYIHNIKGEGIANGGSSTDVTLSTKEIFSGLYQLSIIRENKKSTYRFIKH